MYKKINLNQMNLEEAISLACLDYEKERMKTSLLPKLEGIFKEELVNLLTYMKENTHGKALLEDEHLVGFICFYGPMDEFFGHCKGVFSPCGANVFAGKDEAKTASLLISACMEELIAEGVTQFGLSRYTYNEAVNRSLILNGFGIRCSDAILDLKECKDALSVGEKTIQFQELRGRSKEQIRPMFDELNDHLAQSPCFMPVKPQKELEWFQNDGIRVIAALDQNQLVGYMALDDEAETFVTNRNDMKNICGAYVAKEYRSSGTAKQLLHELIRICNEEGYQYLGVDYETINPTALHFWTKEFTPYTYSFVRRIDERIIQR